MSEDYHHEDEFILVVLSSVMLFLKDDEDNNDDEDNDEENEEHGGTRVVAPTIFRERRLVDDIFRQLGPTFTRRAFRMTVPVFYNLHQLLYRQLRRDPHGSVLKTWVNGARNGLIASTSRLAVALRYFAGGSVYDLCIMFGISIPQIYRIVWSVVDAVNECNALHFKFPEDHDIQRQLAAGFRERSDAEFDSCVGAIDGLLIWFERPSKDDCKLANCGAGKFYCGRKHKFGLNMMGTVDYMGRFLDVEILHPGATSDYLAFAVSNLKSKLERPGFLAPGLVIFGDNAYGNSEYMVTPFKGSQIGTTEDDFNFYHSQLRIQVECAFGKLVHRWGVLRRPLSTNIGIQKIGRMVSALCRLHNFCIDGRSADEPPLDTDLAFSRLNSGVQLRRTVDNDFEPTGLLHGG